MVSAEEVRFFAVAAVALVTGAVALLVLVANPRRTWNQLLAFFLLLVCGNYAVQTMHAIRMAEVLAGIGVETWLQEQHFLNSVGYAFLVMDPAVLAYFASIFPRRGGLATRPWGLPLLGGTVVGFLVLEVATRRLSNPDLVPFDPLRVAFFAYLAACYLFVAWRLLSAYLAEPSQVMAGQLRVITLGVLVAVVPRAALFLDDLHGSVNSIPWLNFTTAVGVTLQTGFRIGVLWLLFVLARRMVRDRPAGPRRTEADAMLRTLSLVFLVYTALWAFAGVTGFLSRGLQVPDLPQGLIVARDTADYLSFAVRWFVFSGAMVVGLVRYQVLSVDLHAAGIAAAAAATLGGFLVVGVGAATFGPWTAAAASTVLFAAGLLAAHRLGALTGRGARARSFLQERGLEVYRAALAARLAQGEDVERDPGIQRLRKRLRVTARQHATLLAIASMEEARTRPQSLALGRYEVLRRLGSGGQASLDLARDARTGDLVALKRFHGGPSRTGLRELEVARRVSHPNIIAIHEVAEDQGETVVVMEYAEGGSVRDLLDREGKVPPEAAAAMVRQALDGLAALHEAGIVHGDLKPENILLDQGGEIKLADFGTARAFEGSRTLVQHATLASTPGTVSYMAPEQARGRPASVESDVYALGAVAYELLTGQTLLDASGTGAYEALQRAVKGRVRGMDQVPPAWAPVVAKATHRDPARRFRSVAEMRDALDLQASSPDLDAPQASRAETPRERRWWGA